MLRTLKTKVKETLCALMHVEYNSQGVPVTLAKHLRGRSHITLVDVGAHEGEFTRSIDRFCGLSRGILVEPQPELARRLSATFREPRFRVIDAVASDRIGVINLEINHFDATSSILEMHRHLPQLGGLDVRKKAVVACPITTLDAVLANEEVRVFDLVKLDVQGAEHLVISGGDKTLERTQLVWTEVSFVRLYQGSSLFHEVHELLGDRGFRLAELESGFRSPEGELLQADALFVR